VLPTSALGAVLYSQIESAALPSSTPTMSYAAPNDVQAADDFTVPAGQSWKITEVETPGYGPTGLKTDIYFYADAGGLPGGELFDQDGIAATNGPSYVSPLASPPTLAAGHYWVSVQINDFWTWNNSNVLHGSPAVWRNPSELFAGGGCKDWTARTSCMPTAGEPDQVFRLLGPDPIVTPPSTAKPSNAFSFGALKLDKKKGLGTLTVNVPGAGTLSLSGTGLKGATASASAAGAVNLTLKATGKAKKKLKKKGKAKATATVVFTPTGGDAATQTKAVTLKKKKKPPPK
jgi:hypothetical protein